MHALKRWPVVICPSNHQHSPWHGSGAAAISHCPPEAGAWKQLASPLPPFRCKIVSSE